MNNLDSQTQNAKAPKKARLWRLLEETVSDLRYAVRMMGKTPGVTFIAVLTLALGIGVNAALFAVYDFLIMRPLPSRSPEELVDIEARNEQAQGRVDPRFSYPDYLDYCKETQAFSDIVATAMTKAYWVEDIPLGFELSQESEPGAVSLQKVSGNYFSTLGAEIVLGRDFLSEEAGPHSGQPVIVVSHLFWRTRLNADPDALGTTLEIANDKGATNAIAYTIIGVTAPNFLGQSPMTTPAGWIPLAVSPANLDDRYRPLVSLTGRMKVGVSRPQAKADLDAIARRLSERYPQEGRANAVHLTPGMKFINFSDDPYFIMAVSPVLLGFAMTLVIACLNVANLLLASGVTRQHEIGIRLSLGASRGRIVRQLLAENFLLCALSAGAAVLLSLWTLQVLQPIFMSIFANFGMTEASNYFGSIEIGLDRHILGFSMLMALLAGLTAGLAPALHSVRRDGLFALKHEGSAFGRKMTPSKIRSLLLIGQVSVCLTLLAVSGLMTGKLLKTEISDSGVSVDKVYKMGSSAAPGTRNTLATDPLGAIETLRNLPGVTSASLVSETPMGKPGDNFRHVSAKNAEGNTARLFHTRVSAGFFETFGVPVLHGRSFTPSEVAINAPVVVVSESVAQAWWPGQEAVGKFLSIDIATLERRRGQAAGVSNETFRDFEVIGVATGIRNNWSKKDKKRLVWFPLSAKGSHGSIFVRIETDSASALRSVERLSAEADVPVEFQEKLSTIVGRSLFPYRFLAWISSVLSGLALVMSTVGLYGMMSFGVNQRVKEIGVRMALGATAERVTRHFVRNGMRLVAWGLAIGLAGAIAFAALVNKAWQGAAFADDPIFRYMVFAIVTAILVLVALVACWLPARRASRIDPMEALRSE